MKVFHEQVNDIIRIEDENEIGVKLIYERIGSVTKTKSVGEIEGIDQMKEMIMLMVDKLCEIKRERK